MNKLVIRVIGGIFCRHAIVKYVDLISRTLKFNLNFVSTSISNKINTIHIKFESPLISQKNKL